MQTRVLLVDDHAVVRAGLASLIERAGDLEVCGEAESESAALDVALATQPDVAVVDWSLGPRDASALIQRLRGDRPGMPVLVLSMHDERAYAARAIEAGAGGYVMKQEASGRILEAIRTVAEGRRYLSAAAAAALSIGGVARPPVARLSRDAVRTGAGPAMGWTQYAVVVAILFTVGFALYEFALPFPFAFDDYPYLLDNPLWREARSYRYLTEFSDFANRATRQDLVSDLSTNFILRPFAYFTFAMNHLAGGFAPAGYRAVNVLIHCANAALVFALAVQLSRRPGALELAKGSVPFIAWTAAALFLVHPLQIESVTYIVQRFTSLGTFFFLASVLLFILGRQLENAAHARRCRRWSVAVLIPGMLTKEFLFLAPVAMVMLDWLALGTPLRLAVRRAWPWLLWLPLIPALVLATAAAQSPHGLSLAALRDVATPLPGGHPDGSYHLHYALTQPSVIVHYLGKLVLPRGLNLDPDHPLVGSILDWRFGGPVAAILGLAALGAWLVRWPRSDARLVLAGCGVLWFFLTLAIDSSVVPLPDVMAEHRVYLPSVGFFFAIACLADVARGWRGGQSPLRWLVPMAVGAAVLLLTVTTVARNEVWRSPVSLWKDTVAGSPGKVRPWMNLGTAYFQAGRWSRAVECYQQALALAPANAQLWAFLSTAENAAGWYEQALASAEQGLRFDPALSNLYLPKSFAFERLGRTRDALATLKEWARLRPASRRARLGLAGVSMQLGDLDQAEGHLEKLRTLEPLSEEQRAAVEQLEGIIGERRRSEATPQIAP
jgi:DNA-binding NarL/FixJ family response regulator